MDSIAYPFTPNKRKLSEERDDDIIVTPSSSFDDSECDDSPRDVDSFVSTPCPCFESPMKRRRTFIDALHKSQLSPPLMPRLHYRPSTLAAHQHERQSGRPVLNLFESSNDNDEEDLSFLAIPTPPSSTSETDNDAIPTFGLSPRTTLVPRLPELMESCRLFGFPNNKENLSSRRRLPALRMRPTRRRRSENKALIEELSLPTLAEVSTIEQSTPVRRSSLPAVAA